MRKDSLLDYLVSNNKPVVLNTDDKRLKKLADELNQHCNYWWK